MKTTLFRSASLAALLALQACAVQPAAHDSLASTAATVAPAAWSVDVPERAVDPLAWWNAFGDPTLHALIASVLQGNLDLKGAQERVTQAEAVLALRDANRRPELDAVGTLSDARANSPPPLGYVRQAGTGVRANWDPDVFGGLHLAAIAARAEVDRSRESLEALRLALATAAASAYVELRWAQTEQGILRDNERIRERALELTTKRLRFGLSTRLDVARAKDQLAELQAEMPRIDGAIERRLHLIAILAGQTPELGSAADLRVVAAVPLPEQQVPAVVPSQALLMRPDVREADARVRVQAADVGQAKSQRYPQFQLSLGDGLMSSAYKGAPTLVDNLFSAALNVMSPIFDAGRIASRVDQSESRLRESELALRQTMLVALGQIEDARTDFVSDRQRLDRLADAVAASTDAQTLANRLYKGGATGFLDVLSAQEASLTDARAMNGVRREHAMSAIALYAALGGGWRLAGDGDHTASTPTLIAR